MKTSVISPEESSCMVRVENISKKFGRIRAVNEVSFEVNKGEILGFLGPNGAGKTTAVRVLTGFFPPTEGRVWIGGEELFKNPREVKRRVGYLPETISMYSDMRIFDYLDFVARIRGVKRKDRKAHLEEKLERCGLWDVRKRMIGHMSKGYKQRVGLAQALVGDPDVLVLDEPTNGLDPKQNVEIRSLIRELGRERTLILSSHILPEVSMVCDRVLIMNQGSVVASGTTEELEASLKKRQSLYITIGSVEKKEQALRIFETIQDVEKVTTVEEKPDQISFSLSVGEGRDIRAELSKAFVQHDILLLEIRTGRLSLEEIFMKIVVNEEVEGSLG